MGEFMEVPGSDAFDKNVRDKINEGKIVNHAFPSALSVTLEEFTEFKLLIPIESDLKVASTYIAESIKQKFSPASKYVYWRVYPETDLIKPDILEDGVLKTRIFLKFYARLLITDKEATHREYEGRLEPIEPPKEAKHE